MFRVKLELGYETMEFKTTNEVEALYWIKILNAAEVSHWDGKETKRQITIDYSPEEKDLKLVSFLNWVKPEEQEAANGTV